MAEGQASCADEMELIRTVPASEQHKNTIYPQQQEQQQLKLISSSEFPSDDEEMEVLKFERLELQRKEKRLQKQIEKEKLKNEIEEHRLRVGK